MATACQHSVWSVARPARAPVATCNSSHCIWRASVAASCQCGNTMLMMATALKSLSSMKSSVAETCTN